MIKQKFLYAQIAMCSTAGEIFYNSVVENSMVIVAFEFNKTEVAATSVNVSTSANSYEIVEKLVTNLPLEGLIYLMVLSDGNLVNGSELLKGLSNITDNKVLITGGIARE